MATYNPAAAKKTADRRRLHLQGQRADRPEGQPRQARHPRDLGLVGLGRLEPDHHEEPAGDRHRLERQARAVDWGAWFPNAFSTKNPTLLWQVASRGSPYGYFYSNLSQNAYIPSGTDASPTGNWEHFANAKATHAPQPVEGDARREEAARRSRRSSRRSGCSSCRSCRCSSAPRWSTYSTKYFHCFPTREELLRRPDLHDVPRQHPLVHPDLPGREGRALISRDPPGRRAGLRGSARRLTLGVDRHALVRPSTRSSTPSRSGSR